MMLIDADALKRDIDLAPDEWAKGRTIYGIINEQPTIDAEPVRHGQWIPEIVGCTETVFKCSKCCRLVKQMNDYAYKASKHVGSSYPYCHCGAKMDLEVQDD